MGQFGELDHYESPIKEQIMKSEDDRAMGANQNVYQEIVGEFEDIYLFPAEAQVFDRFRDQWGGFTILDLGVGAGRTAWVFSPHSLGYTGVDYAPAMIDRCLERFQHSDHRRFMVGDARDLNEIEDNFCDFLIFSFNGIDYIDHEGRQQALIEIRRVLKPGGWFFFSTHSLDAYPFRQPHPRRLRGWLTPLGRLYRKAIEMRMRWRNRTTKVEEAREQGWACLRDYCGNLSTYYIDPKQQVQALEALGFELDTAWDRDGGVFDFSHSPEHWMIHFLFKKSRGC